MIFRQISVTDGDRPQKGLFISKGLFLLLLLLAALSSLFAVALFRGLRQNHRQPPAGPDTTFSQTTTNAANISTSAQPVPQIEINRIKEILGEQRFAEALPAIASLSEKYPDSAVPATFKIHALVHLGRLNEAEEFISSALRSFPQDAELLLAAASFFHATNNPVAAEKMLLKALIANPRMTGAMRGLIATYIRAGLFSMARDAALSGLRRVPGDPGLVNALADSFRMLGEWDNAIERYNEFLLLSPSPGPEIFYHLGTCLRNANSPADKTIQSYKKAIKVDPAFVPALNDLAMLLATSGKATEAIEYISPLLQHSNQAPFAFDTAGIVFLKANRLDNAGEMFEKAHRLEPQNPEFIVHLAAIALRAGDNAKAQQLLQQAFELCRNDNVLRERLQNEFDQYKL